MRKFIDIKGKVSLYYNQITIGLQSVTISDVIVYILEVHSTSISLKKKKKTFGKERGRRRKRREHKKEAKRKEVEKRRRKKGWKEFVRKERERRE